MLNLKKALKSRLGQAKKIAILGVGSDLRGDDAAGVIVAGYFSRRDTGPKRAKYRVFIGATAPENLTGQIKKFKPTHLIVIDSAELGSSAGKARLIGAEELSGASFYTHKLPLKIMVDYLRQAIGCDSLIIGIQPKQTSFGSLPSREIKTAARQVFTAIKDVLRNK